MVTSATELAMTRAGGLPSSGNGTTSSLPSRARLSLCSRYDSPDGDTATATVAVTPTSAISPFFPLFLSPSSPLELRPISFLSFSFRIRNGFSVCNLKVSARKYIEIRVVTDNSSIQSRSFYFYTLISSKCSISAASQPCNAVAPNLHCTELLLHRSSVAYRDQCVHLLIPLNKCRQAEFYLPWKCENESHSYEKCQYELLMERMFRCRRSRNEPPLITLNPRAPPFPSSLKSPMPDSFQNRDDNNEKNNSISNKFLLPRKPPDRMLPYNKAYNHDEDDDEEEGVTEDDEEHNFLHNDEKRKQELDKSMQKPNILVAFLQQHIYYGNMVEVTRTPLSAYDATEILKPNGIF
ncbi:hypothetical protein Ahy_B06g083228 isoform C [Arachis hypogaea]|uniref:NADH dehydrogenase [ubiquinone] 1 beta subcomplex subunit 7 n=1 Tax=Arachis hypogaea TaxID=3818 RepID=A0A444YPM7_ARAHY|nr:hypothetical protein Ahy_B06g083228 isoform C [Arachis hypogaea]